MNLRSLILTAAGVALAAGCAHSTPRELIAARATYDEARAGPASQYAPVQLHEAQKSLDRAERADASRADRQTVSDLAYVATRKAEIAESQARLQQLNAARMQGQQALADAERQRNQQTTQQLNTIQQQLQQQTSQRSQEEQRLQQQLTQQQQSLEEERQAREQAEARAQQAEEQARVAQRDVEQSRAEMAQLQRMQSVAKVRQEERGIVLTIPGSLLFASGKSDLLPSARRQLGQVAQALKADPRLPNLRVEGHTDSVGAEDYNQRLSEARAQTVRDFLENRGIPSDKIQVEGFGKSQPIADNSTPEGRADNRRVEIVLERPQRATGIGGAGQGVQDRGTGTGQDGLQDQGTGGSDPQEAQDQATGGSGQQSALGPEDHGLQDERIGSSGQPGATNPQRQGVSGTEQQGQLGSQAQTQPPQGTGGSGRAGGQVSPEAQGNVQPGGAQAPSTVTPDQSPEQGDQQLPRRAVPRGASPQEQQQ